MKAMKLTLFLIVLITLFSCTGQGQGENTETQTNFSMIGRLVTDLDDQIWAIYQDKKGDYWFGSNGKGVFHFDGKTLRQYSKQDGLIDDTIRGLQGDDRGNVYIATPEGVSKYDGKSFTTLEPIKYSPSNWKLAPSDLWFHCSGRPNDVYRYDGEHLYELELPRKDLNKAFGTEVKGLPFKDSNNSPYSVFGINKDKQGNIWFGTVVAGVFRFDGNSFLWIAENELSTLPDGRVPGVRSMIEDRDGNFWLSNVISRYKIVSNDSSVGYEKFVGIDMSQENFQDRIRYFNSGLSDENEDLWMTTYTRGVWKYDGDELINFPVMAGETGALLISIYQDNEGILWLGTDNVGVFKFNGDRFEKFDPMNN